jgi:hypothetical protein
MKSSIKALLAAAGVAAFAFSPANAYEAGYAGWATKPGALIGASAGVPPPGIYMFNQEFTYQTNIVGPATTSLGIGNHNAVAAAVDVQGFLFVPGWTFLGGTYDAVIVQPWVFAAVGNPLGAVPGVANVIAGAHNTYFANELAWKLPSGFAIKTGLGIYAPDGHIQGPAGLNSTGNPWWTFQPELAISYLGGGWNLTAFLYEEFNTKNSRDGYTTGDIFHADFTATKTIGKWTLGPVAYYVAQVTNDSCSPPGCVGGGTIIGNSIVGNAQRFSLFAIGGLVEYNFGPASLSVWATQEVSHTAHSIAPFTPIGDTSLITQGFTVFATLSYRLWAPEEPAKAPMLHK